jgi:hypothetical protein
MFRTAVLRSARAAASPRTVSLAGRRIALAAAPSRPAIKALAPRAAIFALRTYASGGEALTEPVVFQRIATLLNAFDKVGFAFPIPVREGWGGRLTCDGTGERSGERKSDT